MDIPKATSAYRSFCDALDIPTSGRHSADTSARVSRMMAELTEGLHHPPPEITLFPRGNNDQLIVVRDLWFSSLCAHHHLPFTGHVHVGYLPVKSIAGLSKFARVVDYFSRKPQVQEEMTAEIADYIQKVVRPVSTMVVCEAEHCCMSLRGVKKPGHTTITSAIRGKVIPVLRDEFMALLRR